MKNRFWLFKRRRIFYIQDVLTRKQESLGTTDRREAEQLRHARNEAGQNRALGLAVARAYLAAVDPKIAERSWSDVIAVMSTHGCAATQARCQREMRTKPFDRIRRLKLVETTADDFLAVMQMGAVSTNHFLRRLHNLAIGLGWLPWPVLAPKLWPPVESKPKRAITWQEHEQIVGAERNAERRLYYEVLWETGASQTDAALLTGDRIDWPQCSLTYPRSKTGQVCRLTIGPRLRSLLRQLPSAGFLFPQIARWRATDRAGEFRRRCRLLGIRGVSLHSYRYAWAERAKACGYLTSEVVRQTVYSDLFTRV